MRYLSRFSETEQKEFGQYITRSDLLARERIRFSIILLNAQHRVNIEDLCTMFGVNRNSICTWFDLYEEAGFSALLDKEKPAKKSSLDSFDEQLILDLVAQNAQNLKIVVNELSSKHQIETNVSILRRFLKKKAGLGEGLLKV